MFAAVAAAVAAGAVTASASETDRLHAVGALLSHPRPQAEARRLLDVERNASMSLLDIGHVHHRGARRKLRADLLELPVPPELKDQLGTAGFDSSQLTEGNVDKAVAVLNTMLSHHFWQLDQKVLECRDAKEDNRGDAQEVSDAARELAAQIGYANSEVTEASSEIPLHEQKFIETKKDMQRSKRECDVEVLFLRQAAERTLVQDRDAIGKLTEAVKKLCPSQGWVPIVPVALAQQPTEEEHVRPQSEAARAGSCEEHAQVVQLQLSKMSADRSAELQSKLGQLNKAVASVNDTAGYKPNAHLPTRGRDCHIRDLTCEEALDSIGVAHGQIADELARARGDVVKMVKQCQEQNVNYEEELKSAAQSKAQLSTLLANAAGKLSTMNEQQKNREKERKELDRQYDLIIRDCRRSIHELLYVKICKLRRMRDALVVAAGRNSLPEDCIVTEWDWDSLRCSKSCGGGREVLRREIVAPADGGVACPNLKLARKCNTQKCPTDCVVGHWSPWGKCTSECNGGLQQRTRHAIQNALNGGDACPEMLDERVCNTRACDRDCALSSWSKWGSCSQACGGGSKHRKRSVVRPARGDGTCPSPDARTGFASCNTHSCPIGDVTCAGVPLDVVLVVDVSGSMGQAGFDTIKALVTRLVTGFAPTAAGTKLSIVSFSEGAEIISELNGIGANLVSKLTTGLKWRKGSTMLSRGLIMAGEALLRGGRSGASSTVIAITDGEFADPFMAYNAAQKLHKKGSRLAFMPIGDTYDSRHFNIMASEPKRENVWHLKKMPTLEADNQAAAKRILIGSCSKVEEVAAAAPAAAR